MFDFLSLERLYGPTSKEQTFFCRSHVNSLTALSIYVALCLHLIFINKKNKLKLFIIKETLTLVEDLFTCRQSLIKSKLIACSKTLQEI